MDTALSNGDFLCDSRGFPVQISGNDEILQQILIRLSIKKGSFAYNRDLGSELYKLNIYDENVSDKAKVLIEESFNDMQNVFVKSVLAELSEDQTNLILNIELSLNGELKDVVITI